MIRLMRWLPLLLAVLMVPACGMQDKKAAEAALSSAELAYAQIAEQARNVAPDQAQAIEAGIAAAKASLARGDAAAALASAKELNEHIKTLGEQLPGMMAKLQDDWKTLLTTVPGSIASLKKKLDNFGRPPVGMPGRSQFEAATAALAPLGQQWEQAKSLYEAGKLADAVTKAQQIQADAVKMIADMQGGS